MSAMVSRKRYLWLYAGLTRTELIAGLTGRRFGEMLENKWRIKQFGLRRVSETY
jgi:hypothetical protein